MYRTFERKQNPRQPPQTSWHVKNRKRKRGYAEFPLPLVLYPPVSIPATSNCFESGVPLSFLTLFLFSFSFYYLEGIHKYFVIPKGVGFFSISYFPWSFSCFLFSFFPSFSSLVFFSSFFWDRGRGESDGLHLGVSPLLVFLFYSNLPVSVMPNKRNEHVSCVLASAAGFYFTWPAFTLEFSNR